MQTQSEIELRVSVNQVSCRPDPDSDRWLVAWDMQNLGRYPLQLLAARLPHGRFRSKEQELTVLPQLQPGERARLVFPVACSEQPGTVVENAFLIVRVLWQEKPWRIFTRLRVVFDDHGGPRTTIEMVTLQLVGFSEFRKSV